MLFTNSPPAHLNHTLTYRHCALTAEASIYEYVESININADTNADASVNPNDDATGLSLSKLNRSLDGYDYDYNHHDEDSDNDWASSSVEEDLSSEMVSHDAVTEKQKTQSSASSSAASSSKRKKRKYSAATSDDENTKISLPPADLQASICTRAIDENDPSFVCMLYAAFTGLTQESHEIFMIDLRKSQDDYIERVRDYFKEELLPPFVRLHAPEWKPEMEGMPITLLYNAWASESSHARLEEGESMWVGNNCSFVAHAQKLVNPEFYNLAIQ